MAVTAITTLDNRNVSPSCPVACHKVDVTIPDESDTGSSTIGFSGRVVRMTVDVPALDGVATTVTVTLKDEDGTTLYNKASIAEGGKTVDAGMVAAATPHGVVFSGTMTVTVLASAAQTTAAVLVSVMLYII